MSKNYFQQMIYWMTGPFVNTCKVNGWFVTHRTETVCKVRDFPMKYMLALSETGRKLHGHQSACLFQCDFVCQSIFTSSASTWHNDCSIFWTTAGDTYCSKVPHSIQRCIFLNDWQKNVQICHVFHSFYILQLSISFFGWFQFPN